MVYRCESCGTYLHVMEGREIPVRILAFQREMKGKRIHIPFYHFDVEAEILGERNVGLLPKKGVQGPASYYIPAGGDFPAEKAIQFAELASTRLSSSVEEAYSFGNSTPSPVEIDIPEGKKMAEFLFLYFQVKKRGILQQISYSFNANFKELLYIPFYYIPRSKHVLSFLKESGFVPGLRSLR